MLAINEFVTERLWAKTKSQNSLMEFEDACALIATLQSKPKRTRWEGKKKNKQRKNGTKERKKWIWFLWRKYSIGIDIKTTITNALKWSVSVSCLLHHHQIGYMKWRNVRKTSTKKNALDFIAPTKLKTVDYIQIHSHIERTEPILWRIFEIGWKIYSSIQLPQLN